MRFLFALASIALPQTLTAQQAAAQQPYSHIIGAAVDSIRGGGLRGAIVSVSGTTRSATTDSSGRFRIDSIAPGRRHLELMHPLLDTLGIFVTTPQRDFKAADTTLLVLGVPSAATIVATKCSAADQAVGSAALVGIVLGADTDSPVPGATVSVEWMDYQVWKKSIARTPQRRTAAVRDDGTYRVCGLPDDLSTGVIAFRGADSTAVVGVSFVPKLAVLSFRLPSDASTQPAAASSDTAAAPTSRRPRGRAALTGRVVDATGAPLSGARVALEADEAVTVSNEAGEFTLNGLRGGTRGLSVRRLGFEAVDMPVDLSSKAPQSVTVRMTRFVPVLEAVRVTALRDFGLQRVGFTERRNMGMGKYFSPAEIERRNPLRVNYLLETAPGLRTGTTAGGHRYITGRFGDCVKYFVDGVRWFGGSDSDITSTPDYWIPAAELGAVEVYSAGLAPGEFFASSRDGRPCTAVVIWTKFKLRI